MLLAIDTSTAWAGLALYRPEAVIAECTWKSETPHTHQLAPALAECLERSDTSLDELQGVAVALGPGSFTALRVGLAFAKGICLTRNLPIFGIPTLDILATAQPVHGMPSRLLAVIQAGRGRLAFALYRPKDHRWQAISAPQVTSFDGLLIQLNEPTLICGELTLEQRHSLQKHPQITLASPAACVRRPAVLAELAWERHQKGAADPLATLAPLYLHIL